MTNGSFLKWHSYLMKITFHGIILTKISICEYEYDTLKNPVLVDTLIRQEVFKFLDRLVKLPGGHH